MLDGDRVVCGEAAEPMIASNTIHGNAHIILLAGGTWAANHLVVVSTCRLIQIVYHLQKGVHTTTRGSMRT
jgi:hypothetical protein